MRVIHILFDLGEYTEDQRTQILDRISIDAFISPKEAQRGSNAYSVVWQGDLNSFLEISGLSVDRVRVL